MATIYINGKFCAQRMTGTQRAAASLIIALDDILTTAPGGDVRWVLLCPPTGLLPALRNIAVERVGWRRMALNLWEQVVLPMRSHGSILVSLCASAPFYKSRQVCTIHDAAIFDYPTAYTRMFVLSRRYLFRRLARSALLIPTVSSFSVERLAYWLKAPRSRFRVIPNGVDHIRATKSDPETPGVLGLSGGNYLLTVASDNPTKNLRLLIEAFGALERQDVHLVLVGGSNHKVFADGSGRERQERVIWTGFIDDSQLKWLYEHACAFFLPSIYEGFGLPPVEAMACGCPVAVSDIPSLREVCGDAALYFDPTEIGSMHKALTRMIEDTSLRKKLINLGYRRASVFQWQKSAMQLLQCVHSVM